MTIASTVKIYGQRVLAYLRRQVGSDADAEDLLQEVWYQLSALTDPEQIGNLGAWLFRVARNKIIDRTRKASHQLENYGDEILDEALFAEFSDPAQKELQDLFWQTLYAALDELPENQREVFVLNELEEKTLQEIAGEQGVNLKTVISRKRYAVKHLRQRLYHLYQEINNYS